MLLCIANSASKHLSFDYTQLNDQTVLFQTIQYKSVVCCKFEYQMVLFDQ